MKEVEEREEAIEAILPPIERASTPPADIIGGESMEEGMQEPSLLKAISAHGHAAHSLKGPSHFTTLSSRHHPPFINFKFYYNGHQLHNTMTIYEILHKYSVVSYIYIYIYSDKRTAHQKQKGFLCFK